jgi:hypothetical protein
VAGRREERFDTVLAVKLAQGSGVTRNVSASGIYFVTEVELVAGMPVTFTLEFEDSPGGPFRLKCEARVVRLERLEGGYGVGAAISHYELERIEPEDGVS